MIQGEESERDQTEMKGENLQSPEHAGGGGEGGGGGGGGVGGEAGGGGGGGGARELSRITENTSSQNCRDPAEQQQQVKSTMKDQSTNVGNERSKQC